GTLVYSVECGNGNAGQPVNATQFSCTYAGTGAFIALGHVTDKDGGVSNYSATIAVNPTSATPTTTSAQVNLSSDDVNEDGTSFDAKNPQVWVGTGQNAAQSYTGLRFNNLGIPKGATITEAHLEFYSTTTQWVGVDVLIAGDAVDSSATF